MNIYVTSGNGQGTTKLAAFDRALMEAGISDYNLLYLSSIIPEGARIIRRPCKLRKARYGNRLYIVISRRCEEAKGKWAWAGLGWVQERASGKGVFAEHNGSDKGKLLREITSSLHDMARNRCFVDFEMDKEMVGIKCDVEPVCAVVAAVFEHADWCSV